MAQWYMRCDEVSRRVSDSLERPSGVRERLGIVFHLLMCRYCFRYFRQLSRIRRLLETVSPETIEPVPLDPETRRRIRRRLTEVRNKTAE